VARLGALRGGAARGEGTRVGAARDDDPTLPKVGERGAGVELLERGEGRLATGGAELREMDERPGLGLGRDEVEPTGDAPRLGAMAMVRDDELPKDELPKDPVLDEPELPPRPPVVPPRPKPDVVMEPKLELRGSGLKATERRPAEVFELRTTTDRPGLTVSGPASPSPPTPSAPPEPLLPLPSPLPGPRPP